MKSITLSILATLTLTGCIFSPAQKIIIRNHEAPSSCMDKVDSVTFTDSGEVWHYSCTIGEPRPPKAPN